LLLRKQGPQGVGCEPNFVVLEIRDTFVGGYQLDYRGEYGNLPLVAMLGPHEIDTPRMPVKTNPL